MRVGGETAGLSPSGRILTGRAEGPASSPASALGNKGIDFRTAVPTAGSRAAPACSACWAEVVPIIEDRSVVG
jgi:hypothetical protein